VATVALLAGGATETLAAGDGSGTTTPAEAPSAGAPTYTAPAGPLLADAQLDAIARRGAAVAGDASPVSIQAVDTSLRSAMEIDPHNSLPQAPDAGEAALEASTVAVVAMHGSFTLEDARVPPGRGAPSGTVLTLIVDAHTGQVEGRAISNEEAPGFAGLGQTRVLE
jgi:hypothetical protein